MARSRTARSILLASARLALALPALAREDDAEFVFALADRGYEDLAQKEIQRMLEGSPTPEKRENAEYARCMLLRRTALVAAGSDKAAPGEVREKFAAAGKAYDAFLKAFPNSTKKAEAEFNMANLMKDFAYYLTKSKDKFAASEQDAVAQEAGKTFEEAIRYLTSIKGCHT